MKKLLVILVCIASLCSLFSTALAEEKAPWEKDGVLRIFGIGNSYTEDTMNKIGEVGKYLGIEKIEMAFVYIGGCTVNQHLSNLDGNKANYTLFTYDPQSGTWPTRNNVTIREGLAMDDWDFVIIQESARLAGGARYMGDARRLANAVHALKPSASLVWNMTWSYPDECTSFSEFAAYYNKDNQFMYEGIVATIPEVIEPIEVIDRIIPNATAIQNARQTYLGDHHTRLFRDKLHLTYSEGRYIVAMNTLATLTGVDITPMKQFFRDEKLGNIIVESVLNAQANPYATTPTQYPTAMDRNASKNRYMIQCDDYYGNDGGWLHSVKKSYNWLNRDDYAKKYGIIFGNGEKGSEIAVTLPEEGKTEIFYMMTQSVALPETVVIGNVTLQLQVPANFSGNITIALASGQSMSFKNSFTWQIAGSDLHEGWNEVVLPFDEAQESGFFDDKNFKVAQFLMEGAPGDVVRLANICLDGN